MSNSKARCHAHLLVTPLTYHRISFRWHLFDSPTTDTQDTMSMYSMCWVRVDFDHLVSIASCLLLSKEVPAASGSSVQLLDSAGAIATLLGGEERVAPLQQSACSVLALMHLVLGLPKVLRITIMSCSSATSQAAHAAASGLARVMRTEHRALRTQHTQLPRDTSSEAAPALLGAFMDEMDVAWRRNLLYCMRLRCHTATLKQDLGLARGGYAIMAGPGELGFRAASAAAKQGAAFVTLLSRSRRGFPCPHQARQDGREALMRSSCIF
eukprot:3440727-Prymnesium_polylepis.1